MAWETNTLILPGNCSVAEIENNIEKFGDYGASSVQYFSDKFFENESSAVKFLESLENEVHDAISSFDKEISKIASILLERDEKVKTHWCVIFDYHY